MKRITNLLQSVLFTALLFPIVSFAADEPQVIPLWEKGAPGFEDRRNEPEQAASYWVKNVHNASITVFLPPKEMATGAAVIVCPGGGYGALMTSYEGDDVARWQKVIGETGIKID